MASTKLRHRPQLPHTAARQAPSPRGMMGRGSLVIVCVALLTGDPTAGEDEASSTAVQEEAEQPGWSFSASAYTFFVPDDDDYVMPTFIADHQWLHLEARYNYEDLQTVSLLRATSLD